VNEKGQAVKLKRHNSHLKGNPEEDLGEWKGQSKARESPRGQLYRGKHQGVRGPTSRIGGRDFIELRLRKRKRTEKGDRA